MLINAHRHLRRHRGIVLAALAAAAMAMVVHSALMRGGDNHMGSAAAVCVVIGGCVAVVGVAAFAIAALGQRPLWRIPAPAAPALPFVPRLAGFLVRAGPPDLLAVFRL